MLQASTRKKYVLTAVLFTGVAGTIAGSYAAVPLHRIFCTVTGCGGTANVADRPSVKVTGRVMHVRFGAAVNGMPWAFRPQRPEIDARVGETTLALFQAENRGNQPTTGSATFDVTPLKAAQYFDKVQCFCVNEQTLQPGETANLPVTFFIDPAIEDDRNMDDVTTITLSYTYHPAQDKERKEPGQVSRLTTGETAGKLD